MTENIMFSVMTANGISNQPGIQNVIKQFVYHRRSKIFYKSLHLKSGKRLLLPQKFPSSNENVKVFDIVEFGLMQNFAQKTFCQISLVKLNPDFVFENYVQAKSVPDELGNINASAVQKTAGSNYD
ncbi:MAG: hypothetical protein NC176_06485 [Treponema brennaborense]|nr:hypothetical protein [Treponema brennaborense]